ncbi:MAG: hypothetical protein WC955_09550 [Elusimicrobiota bacterium]
MSNDWVLKTFMVALVFSSLLSRAAIARGEGSGLVVGVEKHRVAVAFKYGNNEDLCIEFERCGVNSLMAISRMSLHKNPDPQPSTDSVLSEGKQIMKSCTDWVGPYIMKSLSFPDNGKPQFTGGWHGSNGDGTGNATARTTSYQTHTYGTTKIKKGTPVRCEKIVLTVTNKIQAYNLKKDVVKEVVEYTILPGQMRVNTLILALDNLVIIRYYGLQTQNSAWNGVISYITPTGEAAEPSVVSAKLNSASGGKKDFPEIRKYVLTSSDGKNELTAWLDREYGLGKMDNVLDTLPCAFTQKYGKSYFNLINGEEVKLRKGKKLYWRGGYVFRSGEK